MNRTEDHEVGSGGVRFAAVDGLLCYARHYKSTAAPKLSRVPVICLHGLTRNSGDFEVLAPFLAGLGRDVYALDFRGRGKSEWDPNPKNYSPAMYAKDVLSLMDTQGIDKAHFIGTSLGGLVTVEVARKHGDRIAGAVINDVGPEIDQRGLDRIASYAGKAIAPQTWPEAAAYTKLYGEAAFPNFTQTEWECFARRTFEEDAAKNIVLKYDPAIVRPLPRVLMKLVFMLLWGRFINLAKNHPMLLLRGKQSDLLSAETVQKFKNKAPHMMVVEIPNRGHAPSLEEKQSMTAIQHFLRLADYVG